MGRSALTTKVWLSHSDLLSQLERRGMTIENKDEAKKTLIQIGYYRLSGYWEPLRNTRKTGLPRYSFGDSPDDMFRPGSNFSTVTDLWKFDQDVKRILWTPIEHIELSLRAALAHVIGEVDPLAHLGDSLWRESQKVTNSKGINYYDNWQEKLAKQIDRSREPFIMHHKSKYRSDIPIWAAAEVFDFGMVSTLFQGLDDKYKEKVSHDTGMPKYLLGGWLTCINNTRNIIAHHARIWNRSFVYGLTMPKKSEEDLLGHMKQLAKGDKTKLFHVVTALAFMTEKMGLDTSWRDDFKEHMTRFEQHIAQPDNERLSLQEMGFPADWANVDLWRSDTKNTLVVPPSPLSDSPNLMTEEETMFEATVA